MTQAVIFDLDNVLIRGSAMFHFGRYLALRGVVDPIHVLRYAPAHARYTKRTSSSRVIGERVIRTTLALVRDVPVEEVMRRAVRFVERMGERMADQSGHADLLGWRALGVPCFLATAGPLELAGPFAARWGLSGAIATRAEVRNGRYTGQLAGPVCAGSAKALMVSEVLSQRGLRLSDATVYASSAADAPLLAGARAQIVVNPDVELRRMAERNGWATLAGGRPWNEPRAHDAYALSADFPYPF